MVPATAAAATFEMIFFAFIIHSPHFCLLCFCSYILINFCKSRIVERVKAMLNYLRFRHTLVKYGQKWQKFLYFLPDPFSFGGVL